MNANEAPGSSDAGLALIEASLLDALAPIAPPAERAAVLRKDILARATSERLERATPAGEDGFVTIRREGEGWIEVMPKVHAKFLHTEGAAQSVLVRLEPGARAPAHDHPDIEECVVLQGEVRYVGGATLRAGDYQLAKLGAHHTELVSNTGALVFLRYAQPLDRYIRL